MTPEPIDLLINARWIVPVVPENTVFSDCALAVAGGRILGIHPQAEAARRYTATETLNLDNHALLPGLVNAHSHLPMTLLRGYADDYPLHTWLQEHIWPAEGKWVSEEFVRDGTELALAEMLRSGTTCFADMYFFPEQVAQQAWHHGVRCQLAFPVMEFSSAWARDGDECIHKGLALHDAYRGNELVSIAFGPHAPYTISDRHIEKVVTYANELDAAIQIHLHETQQEVDDSLRDYGLRPIERLRQLGMLTANTQCVHMTTLNAADKALLAESRAQVIHCPRSNLKLASGFCPVSELLDSNINVALGTDGAASNNSLDMFSEMQMAALLAKGVSGDPSALNAHQALRMATLNGAKALGMADDIGSLEAGKAADIVALALDDLNQQPMYNPVSQLVYTQMGHNVSHVWVAGKALLADRELLNFHHHELQAKAQQWHQRIAGQ